MRFDRDVRERRHRRGRRIGADEFAGCARAKREDDDYGMRKRRKCVLFVLVGLMGAGLVVALRPSGEPVYGGKRLSEWVLRYARGMYVSNRRQFERGDPIGQIGTSAIPYLLQWIEYEPPAWKSKLYDAVGSTLAKVNVGWEREDQREVLADGAANAFGALGPGAKSAIPELARIAKNHRAPQSATRAVTALGYLGKDALAPLLAVVTNQQAGKLRGFAAVSLKELGTNALPAVPILIQCLGDNGGGVLEGAVMALYDILKLEPDVSVPVMVKSL